MDFYQIAEKINRDGSLEIYPDFQVCTSKDLMTRGKSFYAIWDENRQLWSTNECDLQTLVDEDLFKYKEKKSEKFLGYIDVKRLGSFDSKMWTKYKTYIAQMYDNYHVLDNELTFLNTEIKKKDYVSKRLPYPLEEGSIEAYDELIGTLYDEENRRKLEWAIGAIVSGDARTIQKFIVLYGEAGSGKSTFLNVVQKLFEGYYTSFDAKAITSTGNSFWSEMFRTNPLVAIQHDGDLSKIEDNTKLNSIVSHEEMSMNEKYKPSYNARINSFLFMGTNKPVKITDAKSGIIRRLIDVKPSGQKIATKRYHTLMAQIDFELGAIANHCLNIYRSMGKNYYSNYKPIEMMFKTDVFFNFVEDNYYIFKEQDKTTLAQAYEMYKAYANDSGIDLKLPKYKFREELRDYFREFSEVARVDGKQARSVYSGFLTEKFANKKEVIEESPSSLVIDSDESILDKVFKNCPAQYAKPDETPLQSWANVKTKLKDIDPRKLHYIFLPDNHIVIDFDLKDKKGEKSVALNLEAASKWPPTYAEFSKGGKGIHLHYIYDGDKTKLKNVYSDEIEIKTFNGNASLRRKLTKSNNAPIATITSGLPLKGDKMINFEAVKNEKAIRKLIENNLKKEYHPGTKSSIDFIYKILDDAYKSGMRYDVTNLRPKVLAFASNSTNHSDYCVKLVAKMSFASEESSNSSDDYKDDSLIFYDVEVFPNLFIVVWKRKGGNKVKMINPTAQQIEELIRFKIIGFNNRRYDNHMIYARYLGYNNLQCYELSQKIINGSRNAMFGEAYGLSYTDVYDFASAQNKMSLKKWEIKLGIHHQELGLPWDQPVPEDEWDLVADYCGNDVDATEAVFDHLAGDWAARQILAELSGLTVNDTTNQHTIKIVFGNDRNPQSKLVYTDLSEMFPGYKFENGKSFYRGVEVGEGGYVHGEPGMYINVGVDDVTSMHPTSVEQLNALGPYTENYADLKRGRVAIKHKDFDTLKRILEGKLVPFIEDALGDNPRFTLKEVSNGLKTGVNSAYGLTSAHFDNPFKDPRNKDNIVAKRGALFMIDLQRAVEEKGVRAIHIKTDSIKIPNITPEILEFVSEFGKKYGYEFEHETTYSKFCLVNNAVYIARVHDWENSKDEDLIRANGWTATGAQFAHPYIFKTLFSKEPIEFADLCETKEVKTAMYVDMNEDLGDDHNYHFVGKVGAFCPIKPGCGGGILLSKRDEKYNAVTGTKGYRWLEAEVVKVLDKEDCIDMSYFSELAIDAKETISKFGDFEWFVGNKELPDPEDEIIGMNDSPPWGPPCGDQKYEHCFDCPCFDDNARCKLGYDLTDVILKGDK